MKSMSWKLFKNQALPTEAACQQGLAWQLRSKRDDKSKATNSASTKVLTIVG
jgi:hypothetical protein